MQYRALLLLPLLACNSGGKKADPTPATDAAIPATPATVTVAQLQALRWVEGTWRGSQAGGAPFFESYHFLDDSTVRSFNYPDSTFAVASDSGMIRLAGGQLISGDSAHSYVATMLDSASVHFEPQRGATNSFTWTRTDADHWTAALQVGGKEVRVYQMERRGK